MIKTTEKMLAQGSHRSCLPEQTLAKYQPMMRAMGITRIANITGLDTIGIPVVTVCRPNSRAISVAQGKGTTLLAAKASGLMEAIETYHGEYVDLPLRHASYHRLKQQAKVVDIHQLPKLNLNRFSEQRECLWVMAQDISSQESIYVPYEMVHCDYTLPFPTGSGMFMMTTNGLASGNTLSEAICHGLCEVIERDAATLWRIKSPHLKHQNLVDLTTIKHQPIKQLLAQFDQADIQVSVWHISSDIEVPTFYCTIISKNQDQRLPLSPANGQGTHPDKHVAIIRALTEAAQTRLTLISGSRDDAKENEYQASNNIQAHQAKLAQLQSLQPGCDFNQLPSKQQPTVEQDIDYLLEQLKKQQINQVLAVDLTKPEYNIPVVRVIVPGLEGIDYIGGYTKGKRAIKMLEHINMEARQ